MYPNSSYLPLQAICNDKCTVRCFLSLLDVAESTKLWCLNNSLVSRLYSFRISQTQIFCLILDFWVHKLPLSSFEKTEEDKLEPKRPPVAYPISCRLFEATQWRRYLSTWKTRSKLIPDYHQLESFKSGELILHNSRWNYNPLGVLVLSYSKHGNSIKRASLYYLCFTNASPNNSYK